MDAREHAEAMYDQAIDLWNYYWEAAGDGDRNNFPERESIERIQRELADLAWPHREESRHPAS